MMISRALFVLGLSLHFIFAPTAYANDNLEAELEQTKALCEVAKQLRKLPLLTEERRFEAVGALEESKKAAKEGKKAAKRAEAGAVGGTSEQQQAAKRAREAATVAYEASVRAEAAAMEVKRFARALDSFESEYESVFSGLLRGAAEHGGNETIKQLAKECATAVADDVTPEALTRAAHNLRGLYMQDFAEEYLQEANEAANKLEELQKATAETVRAADAADDAKSEAQEEAAQFPEIDDDDSDEDKEDEASGAVGTSMKFLLVMLAATALSF
ncbi:uncharacterized protein TEOVI_000337300 [Trypanosoma equiperdum]|uniref:Trypanosoma glutamic acid/alanine-rich protein domain-containing protein n=2 Tax=Trypanozoon TaxID=39700 RepID=Q57Z47_TRYB2|nr:hypothetical protein Tb927.5.4020 [Trypanosoma brucei brucei TREU927]AAX80603.1 hypothetical protein Tb927.5.4020 [Trypanosoma brucei]AAZ11513.1 hypothetical protein Tb927.5.4020 [Trypanosoma brucei brucei TREU927]SCU71792.1 hypothetical protein, conserved [Trypanosoma equiperdum]